jgi:ABC-type methionine transport system ATPase subunit
MDKGRIAEQGTFAELMKNEEGQFAKFVKEFGAAAEKEKEEEAQQEKEEEDVEVLDEKSGLDAEVDEVAKPKAKGTLMQEEERATGTVGLTGKLNRRKSMIFQY